MSNAFTGLVVISGYYEKEVMFQKEMSIEEAKDECLGAHWAALYNLWYIVVDNGVPVGLGVGSEMYPNKVLDLKGDRMEQNVLDVYASMFGIKDPNFTGIVIKDYAYECVDVVTKGESEIEDFLEKRNKSRFEDVFVFRNGTCNGQDVTQVLSIL